jgi:hypothetical protein
VKKYVLAAAIALAATAGLAGEGMWMPQQIPQIASELRAAGLKMDPSRLADLTGDPLGAVISLGNCTASFVSPEGLVVTNHHCAFGSIQHNSTRERDLIQNGFLAKTREEELPAAPGTRVYVTTKIEDVTARVTGKLGAKLSDAERARTIDRREKEIVAECEKPGGLRCRVASFFEGSQYLLTTQTEITDVRLVYAPGIGVGEYGGEIDNFRWPRHTGDFSLYRAYVDGKPYRPAHYLKVSADGVSDGDFVMVAGYPGRTFRYKTADEVRNYKEFFYPASIRYFGDSMRMLEERGKKDRAVAILNASRVKSYANTLKNYTSVNEGFTKNQILEKRLEAERRLREAIAADPSLAKYASVLDEMARVNEEDRRFRERDLVMTWLVARSSPMLQQAFAAWRWSVERTKKDIDRATGYQERDAKRLEQASQRAQRTIEPGSDRAGLRYFLEEAARLPKEQRIEAIDRAVEAAGGIDKYLDRLYSGTKVADEAERAKMFKETTKQLEARNDAMLELAASLLPYVVQKDERDRATSGAMSRLRPGYFEVLRKTSGAVLYPDANSTLRVTFGQVEGYAPRDATRLTSQTTLAGILEKNTGEDPFDAPKGLLAAARDDAKKAPYVDPQLRDVPVNFTSTVDSTGGNSGSPTLNAKGELVGLLFDGNYESIDSDFVFNPALNRSIHVDTVYMLWVMDAVDGADHLIREMGLQPRL